jgi:hypothetical protein
MLFFLNSLFFWIWFYISIFVAITFFSIPLSNIHYLNDFSTLSLRHFYLSFMIVFLSLCLSLSLNFSKVINFPSFYKDTFVLICLCLSLCYFLMLILLFIGLTLNARTCFLVPDCLNLRIFHRARSMYCPEVK